MAQTLFTDLVTLILSSWLNDVDAGIYNALSAVSGTNTITGTGPTTVTSYAANQRFFFTPANTNTGATTLNISSIGAKNIFLRGAALVGGELFKSQPVAVMYDGTQFNIIGNSATPPVPRSALAGLALSTAGASATMTVAAGQAADSSNQVLMTLASATGKTTSAWAVGSGNGGLDTGAVANGTWYHFYEIMRPDTGVVDVLFSLSASSPTMPTNYTYKKRIGSGLTNGSAQWIAASQQGDEFLWSSATVLDQNATIGAARSLLTLASVPTGIKVWAIINSVHSTAGSNEIVEVTSPDSPDEAPSATATPLGSRAVTAGATTSGGLRQIVRTNTSAQVAARSDTASTNLKIATLGWIDRRGRDD
jgi:hypothetical protein